MATSPISKGIGNLTNFATQVAAAAQALLSAGNAANSTDLWPVENWGAPTRPPLAGIPNLEPSFHMPFEQGRFLERPIGDAIAQIQTKQLDLTEKILGYVNLNKLTLDCQLPDSARPPVMVADSISFVQQIRTYVDQGQQLLTALQANVQILLAAEAGVQNMIQANINALANLLQQICNWNLPSLPSLAALLGNTFHWNGFNFNSPSGFSFNPGLVTGVSLSDLNVNFSFGQCVPRVANLASVFGSTPASISDGTNILSLATPVPPLAGGSYGDPTQFNNPQYISQMQATSSPVFNPDVVATSSGSSALATSLPSPSSIISNYSLPASEYVANIASAVSVLNPIIIQPDDPDYASGRPSVSRLANLRAILIQYVNLATIVASNYDPNLTAAWLIYLGLNRAARGGQWLANFQAEYTIEIAPSVGYVNNTPVPWNNVLGGSGVSAAPTAIPLIAALQADTSNNLKWRLSYIEASLLGYTRTRTWDVAEDSAYLSSFTGSDLDYTPSIVNETPTTTLVLGDGTASFPVSATFPTSIATVMSEVIAIAATDILTTPGYQSTRPQFRYSYDMFGQPTLVDRFSQFWRDFNANLVTFQAQSSTIVDYVVSYVEALNSAINPLANNTDYLAIETDVTTRNPSWTPGSALPTVPVASVLLASSEAPTNTTNGWTTGTFDPQVFLARPDVQAQPLPVQMAMLRTNESFGSLLAMSSNVAAAVSSAVQNAQAVAMTIGVPGWEIESTATQAVPPGAGGAAVIFQSVVFDQSSYVEDTSTVEIQTTSPFILNAVINWDTTGSSGTRTVNLLQNGVVISTASASPISAAPFITQFSAVLDLNVGDVLEVQVSHSCSTPQNLLSGNSFLGLVDVTTQGVPNGDVSGANSGAASATISLNAGVAIAALSGIVIQANGEILEANPTVTTPGVIPAIDGIALTGATAAGEAVTVAAAYGQVYSVTSASFTPGGLLYINANGTLTQDYSSLVQNVRWIMCVGKALTSDTFMYQPHIPTNYTLNF
jgi:hypothetical protein